MRIPAPAALSRIAARFNERRLRADQGEAPPLTETDDENIEGFAQLISQLTDLLGRENDALRRGDVSEVAGLYEKKNELLRGLEIRKPVIEPFLRESLAFNLRLRDLITELTERIATNAELLSAMSEASARIRHEVERVRARHTLRGMYDKSGQRLDGNGPVKPEALDTNL